jgi:hypothetical protein
MGNLQRRAHTSDGYAEWCICRAVHMQSYIHLQRGTVHLQSAASVLYIRIVFHRQKGHSQSSAFARNAYKK